MTVLRRSTAINAILAVAASIGLLACDGGKAPETDGRFIVAPGVTYESYQFDTGSGNALVHLLTVDLTADGVSVDVVMPAQVPAVEPPSVMAENAGAIAVVNGDFFNNDENAHPDAPHTYAPVGPVIMGGQDIKAAVPDKLRMGPSRGDLVYPGGPDFAANQTVLGITADGRATITELSLDAFLHTIGGEYTVDGLNQYGIRKDGIGAFTSAWGAGSRLRAVCGDEDSRNGPCSNSVVEITAADGIVTDVTVIDDCCEAPVDPVADGEVVFVARDGAADDLARLVPSDPLYWEYDLVAPDGAEFTTGIGGYPLVVDGRELTGVDAGDRRSRTIVGHDDDGTTLFMAVVEEATLTELASILIQKGAHGVLNLDGGGSSLLAAEDEDGVLTVRNDPTDLLGERKVANALAVFADPSAVDDQIPEADFGALEGTWHVVAESPGQSSTLTFDGTGHARYTSSGTVVDYWEGDAVPVSDSDGSSFTVEFAPSAAFQAEEPDADRDFTMHLSVEPDGDTLTVLGDGYEQTYLRES